MTIRRSPSSSFPGQGGPDEGGEVPVALQLQHLVRRPQQEEVAVDVALRRGELFSWYVIFIWSIMIINDINVVLRA